MHHVARSVADRANYTLVNSNDWSAKLTRQAIFSFILDAYRT